MSNRSRTNGTSNTNTNQSGWNQRNAWGPALPGLTGSLNMMNQWMRDPGSMKTYQGKRVANLSGQTKQGLHALANNQGYGASGDYYKRVLGGEYLDAGNPYMEAMNTRAMNAVMPGINATFGRSGMTGSTIHQNQLAKGLGDAMAPHMFANYENERNRQMAAAGALPALYSQQANDMLRAGGIRDQHRQNRLNAKMGAFNEQRDRPMHVANAGFGNYLSAGQAFGRNNFSNQGNTYGTTSTTSSPSPFNTIMGGAMMGLGMMNPMMGMMGGPMMSANGPMNMPGSWPATVQAASYGY